MSDDIGLTGKGGKLACKIVKDIRITANVATPTHPFYVNQFGWTRAADLRAGDILVLSNGEYVVVEFIQHEILESPVKVYNFEVEDFHTYFVGEVSVLVHNGCGDDVVGAESSNSSKPMTWNEFQHANKGWSSTELSGRWKKYKSQYVDPLKTNGPSEHGNSLTTSKPAQGYSLRDRTTGEILKYGETTLGPKRYTQAYLDEINADIFWEASGTKAEMHQWQHLKILDYMYVADHRPPLNKSTW